MDTRRFAKNALLTLMLLASGAACASGSDTRQCFRLATQLIGAHATGSPPAPSITIGVRG